MLASLATLVEGLQHPGTKHALLLALFFFLHLGVWSSFLAQFAQVISAESTYTAVWKDAQGWLGSS